MVYDNDYDVEGSGLLQDSKDILNKARLDSNFDWVKTGKQRAQKLLFTHKIWTSVMSIWWFDGAKFLMWRCFWQPASQQQKKMYMFSESPKDGLSRNDYNDATDVRNKETLRLAKQELDDRKCSNQQASDW